MDNDVYGDGRCVNNNVLPVFPGAPLWPLDPGKLSPGDPGGPLMPLTPGRPSCPGGPGIPIPWFSYE